jgi:hypothetical protein
VVERDDDCLILLNVPGLRQRLTPCAAVPARLMTSSDSLELGGTALARQAAKALRSRVGILSRRSMSLKPQ